MDCEFFAAPGGVSPKSYHACDASFQSWYQVPCIYGTTGDI